MKKLVLLLSLSVALVSCGKSSGDTKESKETRLEASTSQVEEQTESKEEAAVVKTFESGRLIKAVTTNEVEEVKQILEDKQYNVNEVNKQNESALLIATHNDFVEIAKMLIDSGADVNQQDNIQDSSYLYAGAQGKTDILAYMLENSEPNQKVYNRFGGNTIIPAAEKGHLDTVKLLLEDGKVDINHQNNFGYTALIEAVALTDGSKVYQDIVSELLKYGADTSLKDSSGKTAADYAKEMGYNTILKMIETKK